MAAGWPRALSNGGRCGEGHCRGGARAYEQEEEEPVGRQAGEAPRLLFIDRRWEREGECAKRIYSPDDAVAEGNDPARASPITGGRGHSRD